MSQYRFGTVNVTNGQPNVVGVGTAWSTNVVAGNLFVVANSGVWYSVLSVQDDLHLTLASNYAGTTATAQSYGVQRNFTPNQNYPTPAFGDTDTASLIAQTLLQLDAQMAALSPLTQILNGSVTINGGISFTATGLGVSIPGLTTLDASTTYLNASGVAQVTASSAGVSTTALTSASLTVSGVTTLTGAATINNTLNVTGVTTLSSTLSVTGAITAPSISGNAGTASKLLNARTIALSGPVTGSISFDGSANISITTSITNLGAASGVATLDSGGHVPLSQLPASIPSGVATLDSGGHVPLSQLPASIQGGLNYQGIWNATTNTPALASGVGTKGFVYKVTTAGTTTLDAISQWNVGDEAVFDGAAWDKWDGVSSEVLSVVGQTSNVTAAQIASALGLTSLATLTPGAGVATALALGAETTGGFALYSSLGSGAFASAYSLPAATTSAAGGVIVGSNLTVTSGTLSLSGTNVVAALGFTPYNATNPTGFGFTGFRNRFINGDMRVAQRGASGLSSGVSSTTYALDRWLAYAAGAAVAVAQVAGPTGFQYALQMTGATGNTSAQVAQRIESANAADLVGQTVTIQANIAVSSAQTIAWYLAYPTAKDSWSGQTGITSGTWSATTAAATFTASIVGLPAGVANGLELVIQPMNGGAFTSGTFTLTGVQIEPGAIATPFERRPIGVELALCQRYLQVYAFSAYYQFAAGNAYNSTSITSLFQLLSAMRSAPSITFSAAATFQAFNGAGNYTLSAISASNVSPTGFSVSGTTTGMTAGAAITLRDTGAGTAVITCSAEI